MAIQIYGFWRSLATFRVRVALKLKGLSFEEIPIDILSGEQFEPAYAAVNAERVVPTFIHDGHSIYQSLAIIEYLDETHPSPPLIPEDPRERAYARSLALITVADGHPLITPRVRNHLAKTFGADAHAIEACGNLAGDVPVRRLCDLVPEYGLCLGLTRKLRDDPCRRPASQHEPRAGPCADRPQARLQGLQRLREPPPRGAAWLTEMRRVAGLVKQVKADHRSPAL